MDAPSWAIRVDGLGKEYELGESAGRPRSLYETLSDGLARITGRSAEIPLRGERFWALRDVGLEIPCGEVVGIVGRNGAGKSTLLKILSRITSPTVGRITLRGKLASLLEVGTGFHPELTGRENVFLNGTILGMRRKEIERKFDDIVAFAEVERFLDTPVKRYSSGMYVRLAFAVAAHLDADILLIDEVLAVGDAAFQRKSLGKMEDVARSGRTVIFVSHNLGAVRSLCSSVVFLERGRVVTYGPTEEGLKRYEASFAGGTTIAGAHFKGSLAGTIHFEGVELRQAGASPDFIDAGQPLEIEVRGRSAREFAALEVSLGVYCEGARLFSCHDGPVGTPMRAAEFRSRFVIAPNTLRPGRYTLGLGAYRPGMTDSIWSPEVVAFDVSEKWSPSVQERDTGLIQVSYRGERQQ